MLTLISWAAGKMSSYIKSHSGTLCAHVAHSVEYSHKAVVLIHWL